MTLEEGHWILIFKRSVVQKNGVKHKLPLANKEKKLSPNCLSIVNQTESLCFMTQGTMYILDAIQYGNQLFL